MRRAAGESLTAACLPARTDHHLSTPLHPQQKAHNSLGCTGEARGAALTVDALETQPFIPNVTEIRIFF